MPKRKQYSNRNSGHYSDLPDETLRALRTILIIFGFAFFFGSCAGGGLGFFGFIVLVLCIYFSNSIKRTLNRRYAPVPDWIDAEVTEHKEPLPKLPKKPDIHPAYTQTLDELQKCSDTLDKRFEKLDAFLTDFFADSVISKNKYMSQAELARKAVKTNLAKAQNAVALFGDEEEPSPRRKEILESYVKDSRQTVADIDAIIDELLHVDQMNTQAAYEFLDESLANLQNVTPLYEQK
jgi:hypothetical protein